MLALLLAWRWLLRLAFADPDNLVIPKDRPLYASFLFFFADRLGDHSVVTVLVDLIKIDKGYGIQIGAFRALVQPSLVDLGYVDP